VRAASAIVALLFAVCAALQLDDPDPVGWLAIYAAAAAASGLAAARRLPVTLPVAIALVALTWAGSFAPGVVRGGALLELAKAMGPEPRAEEARELLGLVLVAAWMGALLVARRRLAPPRRPGA
jgi:hypothetical protein